jgi:predicted membrane channel-forming protein YqfA (hemolysin III family)
MGLLDILFWIILVLSIIGIFVPNVPPRVPPVATLVLFIIIGLRVFPLVLK